MTQPMRILEVVTNFLPGGIQRHALDLTDFLRKSGHHVVLAGDEGDWRVPGDVSVPFNKVSYEGGGMVARIAAIWPAVRIVRRTIREGRIDLVHAHETAPAIIARLATRGLGVPVIFTFHGAEPQRVPEVARIARACADLTLSPSRDGIAQLVAHGLPADRGRSTGLGIAPLRPVLPAAAATLRQQLLAGRAGPLILSLSRLDRQKGIDVMIDVAARVLENAPEATFVVAGKGPLAGEVAGWAQAAGVAQAMRFVGAVSTVVEHLAAADLFLLTSRWENLPISIVEAFRAGLPVVATDCGGVRELVDETVGALVPVEDPETTAQAVLALIEDPARRAQAGSAALIRSREGRFDPETVHRGFEALYRDLLAARR